MDPTGHDATAWWLAHGHPALMTLALLWCGFVLRLGLMIRRGRLTGVRPPAGTARRHRRLAKPAVALVLVGFLGGPASAWWLRGWVPFGTFHSWVGVVAVVLFAVTGWMGLRIEGGERAWIDRHGVIGAVAMLVGAVGAVTGFVLLP